MYLFFLAAMGAGSPLAADDTADGAADAQKYIKADVFRLRKVEPGDHSMVSTYAGLDAETGLPVYTAVIGLDPDGSARRERRRYVDAFNNAVLAHIRQHGLPSSSRKKWVTELNQPTRSFGTCILQARKPAAPQMVSLRPKGEAAASPDGYTLKIATVLVRYGEREVPEWKLVIESDGREVAIVPWDASGLDLFWGPKGSDSAYLRWTEKRATETVELHASLDLRVGGWIKRQES